MSLAPGTAIGRYEILGPVGAGGMGEVYRARDSKLQRDVAIKLLPASFAGDPDRRARFEREAQAIAALSHPNVLAVHDTGLHDGQLFIVTELLEGDTLAERLKAGALPLRKSLDVAVQIAMGLAAAHEKQIVHRDLKPENLFLLRDGRVKILDFGLARHTPSATGASQTISVATDPGVTMGTVGYMAPEQVRGQAVDARTDLFAFGAVLYEMVTGRRAFRRETAAETMTAILRDEPPDAPLAAAHLSPALDRIIRHCLEKEPSQRFQDARDVAFALEALSGAATSAGAPIGDVGIGRSAAPWSWRRMAGLGVLVAAALGLIVWLLQRQQSGGDASAPPLSIGTAAQATADQGLEIDPVLSPDGRFLAYSAGNASHMRIYIRPVSGGRTLALSEEREAVEYQPRFSPDGSQILYLTPTGAFVASALGGTSRRIASGAIRSVAWAPDGRRIAVSRGDTIATTLLDGSAAEQVLGKVFEPHSCAWAPTDRWIACVSGNGSAIFPGRVFGNIAPSRIVLIRPDGGPVVEVAAEKALNQSPVWSADGRVLFFVSNREGPRDIYAAEIGDDGRVQEDLRRVTTGIGVHSIALSSDGRLLAYSTYTARANLWALPIPARGVVDASSAGQLTSENQIIEAVSVSRDGRWLIFDSDRYQNSDIFRMPITGGAVERLTTDLAEEFAPDVSPDGKELAYHSFRTGTRDIVIQPLEGGPAVPMTSTPLQESYPIWSPKGQAIAYTDQSFENGELRGLFVMTRDATHRWSAPLPLIKNCAGRATWSLDGASIVCVRGGSVIVVDVASRTPRVAYAPAGPDDPFVSGVKLSEDGRIVYFKSHDAAHRASIWSVPFEGGKPTLLVRFTDPLRGSNRADFAVGAGQFFFTLEERQADIWVADTIPRTPRR